MSNENQNPSGSIDIKRVTANATPGQAVTSILTAYPECTTTKKGKPSDATKFRPRMESIADYCARRWKGDLIEIGCLYGATTLRLARVARYYGRRVICVDPWKQEPFYKANPFGYFQKITAMYSDIIDIVKMRSQEQEAIDYVQARDLCFALVDGAHSYKAVKSDLMTVAHCRGIIAVDDLFIWEGAQTYRAGIRKAMLEASIEQQRIAILSLTREGYLLSRRIDK